jgi:cell wall-associated NlpC family hydrolase
MTNPFARPSSAGAATLAIALLAAGSLTPSHRATARVPPPVPAVHGVASAPSPHVAPHPPPPPPSSALPNPLPHAVPAPAGTLFADIVAARARTVLKPAAQPAPAASAASAPSRGAPASGPTGSSAATVLGAALSARGTPYVWGGTSRSGFDCSGLVRWAFNQAGISLPRSSFAQSEVGTSVPRSELRPGDLVFFYSPVHHVGIYVGHGEVVHAPESGDAVKVSPLNRMPFHNARRVG